MSYNYPIKYRTFEQLMSEIEVDFKKYSMEGLIEPHEQIKVVKRVNYDLGLRIMMTKELIIDIENSKARLPEDFYTLNFGLICDEYSVYVTYPQGTYIDERLYTPYQETPANIDACTPGVLNCRTTVEGCNCGTATECGSTQLCPPPCNEENNICSTNEIVTTTVTTTTPGSTTPVHMCLYIINTQILTEATDISIDVSGVTHDIVKPFIINLNALGQGTFISTTYGDYTYINVIGSEVYGDISINGRLFSPVCSTVTTYENDTHACCWIIPSKEYAGITNYFFMIDGVEYLYSGVVDLNILNGLGLGVFTLVIVGEMTMIVVTGHNDYGAFDPAPGDKPYITPICTPIITTPESTVTTTTTEQDKTCYTNPPVCSPRVVLSCDNQQYELVQVINTGVTYTYSQLIPLRILDNAEAIDCDCPNLYVTANTNTGWIKDGFLKTNFETGKVYINYQAVLVDDEDNILVPDHDGLNDYYEYAVKKRILENLIMNDEAVAPAKVQLIEQGYREARRIAVSLVNTPNFNELKKVWEANRKAQYVKYYDMFKSYRWL